MKTSKSYGYDRVAGMGGALLVLLMMVVPATSAGTCNDLSGLPFVTVDLADGVGAFGTDAVTEFWQVGCPEGVDPCPGVTPP